MPLSYATAYRRRNEFIKGMVDLVKNEGYTWAADTELWREIS